MRNFKVIYGFLPEETYKQLKQEIDMNDAYKGKMMQGMRSHYDIVEQNITTPHLKSFIEKYCNNPKYWFRIIEDLHIKEIIDMGEEEFTKKFRVHIEPESGIDSLPTLQFDKEGRIIGEEEKEEFFYSRIDVGYGLEGYGIENGGAGLHIDNPNRVISSLLYFSDQSDFEGGEFEVCNEDGSICQQISLRENLCVVSSQNKYGWHRVNPLKKVKNNKPRIGIYFALSSTVPFWKDR